MTKRASVIAAVLFTSSWLVAASHAQTDPFYKNKQIKIVVGFTAGGIIDLWARLFTQYLGKYIPGNPDLVVQNMPGGGSMIAANQLYNIAQTRWFDLRDDLHRTLL